MLALDALRTRTAGGGASAAVSSTKILASESWLVRVIRTPVIGDGRRGSS